MKNILYYIGFLAVGILIGSFFTLDGCGKGKSVDVASLPDTVFITKTDTLTIIPEPKVVKEKVFITDKNGVVIANREIERLTNYCNEVQGKLSAAYMALAKGEQKQVELANLLAATGEVDLPVNHYEKEAYSEKTNVRASISFDTYGYVRGDSLQLILNDEDAIEKQPVIVDRTRKKAIGLMFSFNQELGGEKGQRADATIYKRSNFFTYGIKGGANVDEFKEPYLGVVAGVEFGQKKK